MAGGEISPWNCFLKDIKGTNFAQDYDQCKRSRDSNGKRKLSGNAEICQPPYSPALASSYYRLFRRIKKDLIVTDLSILKKSEMVFEI